MFYFIFFILINQYLQITYNVISSLNKMCFEGSSCHPSVVSNTKFKITAKGFRSSSNIRYFGGVFSYNRCYVICDTSNHYCKINHGTYSSFENSQNPSYTIYQQSSPRLIVQVDLPKQLPLDCKTSGDIIKVIYITNTFEQKLNSSHLDISDINDNIKLSPTSKPYKIVFIEDSTNEFKGSISIGE